MRYAVKVTTVQTEEIVVEAESPAEAEYKASIEASCVLNEPGDHVASATASEIYDEDAAARWGVSWSKVLAEIAAADAEALNAVR